MNNSKEKWAISVFTISVLILMIVSVASSALATNETSGAIGGQVPVSGEISSYVLKIGNEQSLGEGVSIKLISFDTVSNSATFQYANYNPLSMTPVAYQTITLSLDNSQLTFDNTYTNSRYTIMFNGLASAGMLTVIDAAKIQVEKSAIPSQGKYLVTKEGTQVDTYLNLKLSSVSGEKATLVYTVGIPSQSTLTPPVSGVFEIGLGDSFTIPATISNYRYVVTLRAFASSGILDVIDSVRVDISKQYVQPPSTCSLDKAKIAAESKAQSSCTYMGTEGATETASNSPTDVNSGNAYIFKCNSLGMLDVVSKVIVSASDCNVLSAVAWTEPEQPPQGNYVYVNSGEEFTLNEGQIAVINDFSLVQFQLKETYPAGINGASADILIIYPDAQIDVGVENKHFMPSATAYPDVYQSDSPTKRATTLLREVRNCKTKQLIMDTQIIKLGSYGNYVCGSRYQEHCIDDGSFDMYYEEKCLYDETGSSRKINLAEGQTKRVIVVNGRIAGVTIKVVSVGNGYAKLIALNPDKVVIPKQLPVPMPMPVDANRVTIESTEAGEEATHKPQPIDTSDTSTGASGAYNGCAVEKKLLGEGTRAIVNDVAIYCNPDKTIKAQLPDNKVCTSDYECLGNKCTNGKCVNYAQSEGNIIQKVWRAVVSVVAGDTSAQTEVATN